MENKSITDELLKKRKDKERQQKQYIQDVQLAAANLFNSKNGKFYLKYIMNCCLWNEQTTSINPDEVLYKKGRRDIWVLIRNTLPKDILADVEIFNMKGENYVL